MADKINPNSFFNQSDDGTASSALSLAQQAFNISNDIKVQMSELIKSVQTLNLDFSTYKEETNNTIQENKTSITNIFNSFSELGTKTQNLTDEVKGISNVFFDYKLTDEGFVVQNEKVKKGIEERKEFEEDEAADKAWAERDRKQKAGTKKPTSVPASGGHGGAGSTEEKKRPEPEEKGGGGLFGAIGGLFSGAGNAIINTGGLALAGIKGLMDMGSRSMGGIVDAATGGLTDVDGKGGKTFGLMRGITGGIDKLTGDRWDFDKHGKSKDKGDSKGSGILGPISSDVDEMVNKSGLEQRVSNLETKEGIVQDTKKGEVEGKTPSTPTSTKDSISLESSKSAVVEQGQVVSGDMNQAKADYTNKKLELVKYRQQLITRYGRDSDEVKQIDSQISGLTNNYMNMIQSPEGTTEKGLKPEGTGDGFKGKGEGKGEGTGGGFKRAVGGLADFATGGMFDFDKKNRKGAPKDFGIRRVAGGVADWATMGVTDFDKRGKGNLQVNPLFGGKDKAWGSANEQAKRREKQSGMGIKRGIGGALDFATLGTFDFDKQNRKGAPKGWGIKRVAGGLADAITMGATDFDKRGTGIGQMKLGEMMSDKKRKQQITEAMENSSFSKKKEELSTHPLDRKDAVYGNLNDGKPMSRRELAALAESGDKEAIKYVEGMNKVQSGQPQGGSFDWQKKTSFTSGGETNTSIQSYSSGGSKEFMKDITQPPSTEGDMTPPSEASPPPTDVQGIETGQPENQPDNMPADAVSTEHPAVGTECQVDCINMLKNNSYYNLGF